MKNKSILKEMTSFQIIGVGVSYLIYISLVIIGIYMFSWIGRGINNHLLKETVQFIVFLLILYLCSKFISKVLNKITGGVLPKE
ncbi:hypothetical protein LC087_16630 [Bacillus carboniphilus]|uniref:Uncharacterized protein n=1 Tax=Bacillus carboniphilus TaxID=86663 RepID=A0ABY9JSE3_9BACI|nr:hypothetical protein [Bacillus carboniphilus]WLR42319.1 hypothetical protein LC087_16630 [Bacillus carboniphilus]